MLKKLVLVLSCACAINTCFAQNIANKAEADAKVATDYNYVYDEHGRVIYSSAWNKAYEAEWAVLSIVLRKFLQTS